MAESNAVESVTSFFEVVDVFFVVGVGLLLLGLTGGTTIHDVPIVVVDTLPRIVAVVVGLLFCGLAVWNRNRKTLPRLKKLGITIESPRPNDQVARLTVHGRIKVKKLPHGYRLRLLREWENNEYFPIWGKVVADFKNGTWEAVDTDIGGNPGDKRKLKICVVDADANAYLDYFLTAHKVHKKSQDLLRNAGVNEGPWLPGFDYWPNGILVCAEVSVRRQS